MNIFQEAAALLDQNIPFAMTTITKAKGSTPRNVAKMIVKSDGSIVGTIGGGLSEAYVIEEAVKAIREKKSRFAEYVLNRNAKDGLEMDCGGKMSVFIEYIDSNPKLVVVGGGHVGLAVAKAADFIGLNITIVENREEFATTERFPFADTIVCDRDLNEALNRLEVDERTYIVLLTGSNDELALRNLLPRRHAYIGMMGSGRKAAIILENLKKEGFPQNELDSVFAPIGLDLGAETPEELAISILSEMMKIKAGRDGTSFAEKARDIFVIRGGGDLATGVAHKLVRCGFQAVILEVPRPTVIRRTVSFAQAVYDGETTVEGITARRVEEPGDVWHVMRSGEIPVVVDETGSSISQLKPRVVIDATMAKKNLGTDRKMAPIVIGLGPGFEAGRDVDAVIETKRGHDLGRAIFRGGAESNTGSPEAVDGYTTERLIRADRDGVTEQLIDIGDSVEKGTVVARIGDSEVTAAISGVLRGMIQPGTTVAKGMKIGDIDPRGRAESCYAISDKARAVGGGVLEAYMHLAKSR